ALTDIATRIGGRMAQEDMILPYFTSELRVTPKGDIHLSHRSASRNEQTFIHIHMAMGGVRNPTGNQKSFKEFPNTVSKVSSMQRHVEQPLANHFANQLTALDNACRSAGAMNVKTDYESPDRAFFFQVFPKVGVTLLFWDAHEDFEAEVKLLFDETVTDHLDIESIMFLSEHLTQVLTKGTP
ncbi:MAG: DUF3786 domain-containing protein, partial [Desulfobacterales bacterium]|nr:DUF3786 domain-containing protein [Desulfobacterales bacterium]